MHVCYKCVTRYPVVSHPDNNFFNFAVNVLYVGAYLSYFGFKLVGSNGRLVGHHIVSQQYSSHPDIP